MLQPLIKQPTSKKIEILIASLNIDRPQIYMIPQKVTIDSALRIFQYKILTFYTLLKYPYIQIQYSSIPPPPPLCSLGSQEPEDV